MCRAGKSYDTGCVLRDKKVWRNQFFWVLVLAFLGVNCYRIRKVGMLDPAVSEGELRLYKELAGELTEEKIKFVVDNYTRYGEIVKGGNFNREKDTEHTYTGYIHGDYIMFLRLFEEWKELYEYRYYCRDIAKRASENVRFFEEKGNSFEVKRNEEIVKCYGGRRVQSFYRTNGVRRYLEYDFSGVLILFLILLVASELIFVEHKTKMNAVIACSPYGGMRFLGTKVIFLLFATVVLAAIFYGSDFLFFYFFYGMDGLSEPLFYIMEYKNTPVGWTVLEYQLVSVAIKIVGLWFFAVLVFFFSYLLLNQIYTVIFSVAAFGLAVLVCERTSWVFNPVVLFINRHLFSGYTVRNVFGQPVPVIAETVAAVLLAIFFMLLFLFWKQRGRSGC